MTNKKTCIISGIAGQDAAWMTRILLKEKNWDKVYGLTRPSTTQDFWRLKEEELYDDPRLEIIECDITDSARIGSLVARLKPEWFVNLAAISAVGTSFYSPVTVFNTNTLGPLYCLEAIKDHSPETRFYQASTSEMIANSKNDKGYGDELTNMIPVSPYAVAKLAAHNLVRIYRDSYNLFACSSVLYNHGSKYRGEYFIERKIGKYVAEVKCHVEKDYLYLGNLEASRDIGHAYDYMWGVYKMLLNDTPYDYTLCTGRTYSIKQILETAFNYIGKNWKDYVKIDESLFRPLEVHHLVGDYKKARQILNWFPMLTLDDILTEIIEADIARIDAKYDLKTPRSPNIVYVGPGPIHQGSL